ncbi:VacJ family lipoprotein [Gayadomonas joobiniege]|uniref:MlaA family lipoprotein n=1 Tax=Gayadomonas joobiniege TaxID=1234606 RepID=UPI0003736B0E|nr:VacJ family lipoprotein [Gayadomonas joobiniege]
MKQITIILTLFVALASGCSSVPDEQTLSSHSQNNSASQTQSSTKSPQEQLGPYEKPLDQPAVVAYEDYYDPLESINRPIFVFNDYVYRYFLIPLAEGYTYVVPQTIDDSVENFFDNLREPISFLNNIAQGKIKDSGISLARFGINTTLGLLGLFDTADSWFGLAPNEVDLADTLAFYGMDYGAYIVLPFIGPSDVRDTLAFGSDFFLHPLNNTDEETAGRILLIWEGFDDNKEYLKKYPDLTEQKKDPYTFVRNFYLQQIQRDQAAKRRQEAEKNNQQEE